MLKKFDNSELNNNMKTCKKCGNEAICKNKGVKGPTCKECWDDKDTEKRGEYPFKKTKKNKDKTVEINEKMASDIQEQINIEEINNVVNKDIKKKSKKAKKEKVEFPCLINFKDFQQNSDNYYQDGKRYACAICKVLHNQLQHSNQHQETEAHQTQVELLTLKLEKLTEAERKYKFDNTDISVIMENMSEVNLKEIQKNKQSNEEVEDILENIDDNVKGTYDDIKDIIYKMQCILRNEEGITGINAMHHQNLIILISALTDERCRKLNIPLEMSYENIKDLQEIDLYQKIYNPSNQRSCVLHHIRNAEIGFSKDLPFEIKKKSTIKLLLKYCDKIDLEYYFKNTDFIGDIYEHFINREGKTMKDLGQYFTDRSLIKYLVKLCNPELIDGKIQSVADLAAGTGGFLQETIQHYNNISNNTVDWNENFKYLYGNDLNLHTSALLKLSMFFNTNVNMKNRMTRYDSLCVKLTEKYDILLLNPPFGVKGLDYNKSNDTIKDIGIKGTKGEVLFLQLAMGALNDNGKCCIVVPEGVLFNSTKMYKDTRKYLLENFNLKKVIKVGEGEFFKNTGVKTSVLYFEKTGTTQDIEFIQVDKVNDNIQEVPLMNVHIDKIIENDYSLNMNLYKEIVLDVNGDFEVVELGNISEYINYKNSTEVDGGKFPFYTCSPNIKKCNKISLPKDKYILIGTRGTISKGVHYVDNFDIGMGNNLFAIKVNDSINSKYVYYYFKLNTEQINNLITGSTIPMVSKSCLSKLKVIIPSLEVQNRIVEQLDNIYENEINTSKEIMNALKKSIETIMKNTIYRDDLQEFKIKDVFDIKKGHIQTTKIERIENGNYPVISKAKNKSSWIYINEYDIDGEYIVMANEFAGNGDGDLPLHYINGKFSLSCLAIALDNVNPSINIKYVYYILNNNIRIFNDYFQSGSCKKKLDIESFQNYKIHIPSIEVQREILSKIEPKEKLIEGLEKNITCAENEAKEIMSVLFNQNNEEF